MNTTSLKIKVDYFFTCLLAAYVTQSFPHGKFGSGFYEILAGDSKRQLIHLRF
jgi:hypothetical protein